MKKVCTKCKKNKPLEDYYKNSKQSKCKSCHNAANKKYRAEHKQERFNYERKRTKEHRKAWMLILKEIYGKIACVRCGYSKCFAALDFHHRKPETKKFDISPTLKRRVTAEKIKEIKKCDLLCANCHRELHNGY